MPTLLCRDRVCVWRENIVGPISTALRIVKVSQVNDIRSCDARHSEEDFETECDTGTDIYRTAAVPLQIADLVSASNAVVTTTTRVRLDRATTIRRPTLRP